MKLLVLSNGHGEDIIAVRIIEQLQCHFNVTELVALPLVGKGNAYRQLNISILGKVRQMPSGGFIYMDSTQLWRDVRGGLLQLSREQLKVVCQWGKNGGSILAVGDIVPLLFAWISGADYAFVGTAKSEYYLRDERGWLPQTSWLERQFGSVYLPWERWLMSHPRCKAVFPRDSLTTQILQQWSIPAFDLGNPMMDGLETEDRMGSVGYSLENPVRPSRRTRRRSSSLTLEVSVAETTPYEKKNLYILLLPGSRMPEAERNWQLIIEAVREIASTFGYYSVVFLAAIAPSLTLEPFARLLLSQGWNSTSLAAFTEPVKDAEAIPLCGCCRTAFSWQNGTLILTQNAYAECLQRADVAIAMAGTATEQFVGLGKPAITIPGEGPQFTYAFAEAQTRLLGCSVILVENPERVAETIQSVLNNSQLRQQIAENGKRRMGTAGAAGRIAHCLVTKLLDSSN
ncbi:hypothetical protein IQ238_08275 [Pleurocapsales cyanobacterium LEGE 06147]|nr:hypothetical protein [Pleurocapsales cyanobacterium LEGE 06147]